MGTNRRLTGVLGAVLGGILVLGAASSATAVPATLTYGSDAAGRAILTVTTEASETTQVILQFNERIGGPVAPTGSSITVELRCIEGSWVFGDESTRVIVVESIQVISDDGFESYNVDPALCSAVVPEPEMSAEPIDTLQTETPTPLAATPTVPTAPRELAETGSDGIPAGLWALTLLAIGAALSTLWLPQRGAHRTRTGPASV